LIDRENTVINRFLNYVEIRTKITSLFAFLMTLAYLFYKDQPVSWNVTFIFFASMFLFDLTTTAINNYIDTKTNAQVLQFKRSIALAIILVLLGISTALGLYLVYLTDLLVLILGGLCFLCGIFYTYGPVPISRQPLGEVLSGIFYGLLIPFILLYINMPAGTYINLDIRLETISITLHILPILTVLLLSVAPVCTTANIMLANNICDLESDIAVKRHTLPYYLGNKALPLFAGIYYCTYLATMVMVAFKIVSPIMLLSLLTIVIVQKNIRKFFQVQEKSKTFILSIKNYVIIMTANTLLMFISGFFS
jgi:1,4-dihydroxy-2-naphthoate octaprenyltransferase